MWQARSVRGKLGYSGTQNTSGENQMALDVIADEIFCNHVASTSKVGMFASEEQEGYKEIACEGKECFSVAFDPLDGSSLIDTNFSIGSIFSVFPGKCLLHKTGRDMVAAGYILYGPRTILVVATKKGAFAFSENSIGEFVLFRENFSVAENAEFFAPGNLRAVSERKDYEGLVQKWSREQKTLRYSGGMVPDIHLILSKGSGIFSYPSHSQYPHGKLRLLYECTPLAFVMECCGGSAKDETGRDILDLEIEELHQRTSIFIGSRKTVEAAVNEMSQKYFTT
jgi:fructose-1,6-bisphosphatase I